MLPLDGGGGGGGGVGVLEAKSRHVKNCKTFS